MTVRRRFAFAFALLVLLAGSGCGGGDTTVVGAETEESLFREGQQLRRQGRDSEALNAFLKVIEKRGDREAAESHFEAGLIYLHHIKDPVEAIHHFRKYLYHKPTSPQAQGVRGLIDTARREFAKTLPARPPEEQALRVEAVQEVEKLRRENDELRAEVATLRGGGATPVRSTRSTVNLSLEPQTRTAASNAPVFQAAPFQPAPTTVANVPPPATARPAPAPTTARVGATSGKTHTVAPKETLYGISVRYYGTGRQMEAIFEANRDQMKSVTDLRIGMTLKLP
jgi:LysM repeat protein